MEVRRTCLAVAVACARKTRLGTIKAMDRYELRDAFNGVPSSLDMKYGVAVIIALTERQKKIWQHSGSVLTIPWEEDGATKHNVYCTDLAIHNNFRCILQYIHGILLVDVADIERMSCGRACHYRSLGYRLILGLKGRGPSCRSARHRVLWSLSVLQR